MTIEISPETEELLMERMQTGCFANFDAALYQALDLSPPTRRERKLIKSLQEMYADNELPGTEPSPEKNPKLAASVAIKRKTFDDRLEGEPTMAAIFRAGRGLGGDDLDFSRSQSMSRDIEL